MNSKKISVHLMDVLSFINATWSCINEKDMPVSKIKFSWFQSNFWDGEMDGFINIYLVKKTNKSFLWLCLIKLVLFNPITFLWRLILSHLVSQYTAYVPITYIFIAVNFKCGDDGVMPMKALFYLPCMVCLINSTIKASIARKWKDFNKIPWTWKLYICVCMYIRVYVCIYVWERVYVFLCLLFSTQTTLELIF